MGDRLSDGAILATMLELFGPTHTVTLCGWALLAGTSGIPTGQGVVHLPLASPATRYRVLSDFRRLRDRLVELGYQVDEATVVQRVSRGLAIA